MTVRITVIVEAVHPSCGRSATQRKEPLQGNVIKLRRIAKNQEEEQVIEKIACFFCMKTETELAMKQLEVCGEAP